MYFQTTSPYNVTSVIAFNWLTISNYSVAHVTWIWGDCLDDLGPEAHFIGKCVGSEKRWPLYEPHVCWMPVWYLESYSTLLHLHFIICKMRVSEQCLGYQLLCNKPPKRSDWLGSLTHLCLVAPWPLSVSMWCLILQCLSLNLAFLTVVSWD